MNINLIDNNILNKYNIIKNGGNHVDNMLESITNFFDTNISLIIIIFIILLILYIIYKINKNSKPIELNFNNNLNEKLLDNINYNMENMEDNFDKNKYYDY